MRSHTRCDSRGVGRCRLQRSVGSISTSSRVRARRARSASWARPRRRVVGEGLCGSGRDGVCRQSHALDARSRHCGRQRRRPSRRFDHRAVRSGRHRAIPSGHGRLGARPCRCVRNRCARRGLRRRQACDMQPCFAVASSYGFHFIGGHPMAGIQYSGFRHARVDLFAGQSFVIVPPGDCDRRVVDACIASLSPCGFSGIR